MLLILFTSNLTISYAYSEGSTINRNDGESGEKTIPLKTIMIEFVKDNKLHVQVFHASPMLSPLEIDQVLLDKEGVVNWAIIDGKTTKSGIVLYNGKTIHAEKQHWEIMKDGNNLQIYPKIIDFANKSQFKNGFQYMIIFELEEDSQMTSYFTEKLLYDDHNWTIIENSYSQFLVIDDGDAHIKNTANSTFFIPK